MEADRSAALSPAFDPAMRTAAVDPMARSTALSHVGEAMILASLDISPETSQGVQATTSDEQLALVSYVGGYFDTYMSKPHYTHETENNEQLLTYKQALTEAAVRLFNPNTLTAPNAIRGEENILLNELGSMLTSVSHNAGIYYSEDDVPAIFNAVATEFFADPTTQQQLQDERVPVATTLKERAEMVSSLDREVAMALIKDESGQWGIAKGQTQLSGDIIRPLEILREDNADKSGWNKYRMRAPVYTRQQTGLYDKPVADGWFTSEWHQDPNYWSATVRSTIAETAKAIGAELGDSTTRVLFMTEGGMFKGSATPGTDLDTQCTIICDSPADFDRAHAVVSRNLLSQVETFPFALKKNEFATMPIQYISRPTGESFVRNETGHYQSYGTGMVEGDQLFTTVREHEKGLAITTPSGVTLFRKPAQYDGQGLVRVAISTSDGSVHQVAKLPERVVPVTAEYDEDDWAA